MDLKGMADKAKQIFQQRGGAQAAKGDAEELRDISRGQGSATDKAKAGAEALREPGAHQPDSAGAQQPDSAGSQPPGGGDPQPPA